MTTSGSFENLQSNDILRFLIKETVKEAITSLLPDLLASERSTLNLPPKPHWITRQQVAQKFRVSLPTVDLHTKKGNLKAYYIGKKILFNEIEIDCLPIPFDSILRSKK